MKKTGVLNRDIAAVIAAMGHYDRLVISDSGFPVPPGVPCIDLVVAAGEPSVFRVLEIVVSELEVEELVLADETGENAPERRDAFVERVAGAALREIPMSEFFELAADAKAVIRTGEVTKYSNCMLVSGVTY